jgi:hypothetical protein
MVYFFLSYLNDNKVSQHMNVPVLGQAKKDSEHTGKYHANSKHESDIDALCYVTAVQYIKETLSRSVRRVLQSDD